MDSNEWVIQPPATSKNVKNLFEKYDDMSELSKSNLILSLAGNYKSIIKDTETSHSYFSQLIEKIQNDLVKNKENSSYCWTKWCYKNLESVISQTNNNEPVSIKISFVFEKNKEINQKCAKKPEKSHFCIKKEIYFKNPSDEKSRSDMNSSGADSKELKKCSLLKNMTASKSEKEVIPVHKKAKLRKESGSEVHTFFV